MKMRLALLLCACSTACAEAPPVINNSGGVPNPSVPPSALTNDYELMKRLEQMQAEVQQLTGKVEEQAFHIEELKKQQKNMYTDFDDRIQNLETKSGGSQPIGDSRPAKSSGSAAPGSGSAGGTSLSSSNEPPTSDTPQSKSVSSAASAPPMPASEPVPPPAPEAMPLSATEKQEYQSAYDNLRNGRTAQAITQFNGFIANHPGSTYAGNAQYWLGEAHRVNMDNNSARQAFNTVVEKYPRSAKVSDALLKIGYIDMEEKNTEIARETLTRVTTEYANTRAAALAEKKLATLR
jgi:tol-pal system protein YbgF